MFCVASSSRAISRVAARFNPAKAAVPTRATALSSLRYASSASPAAAPAKPKAAKKALSSCPAGTVLTGLNVLKDQPEVTALPDEEYPAWLWTILDKPKATEADVDPRRPAELKDAKDFAGYKKQLRSM